MHTVGGQTIYTKKITKNGAKTQAPVVVQTIDDYRKVGCTTVGGTDTVHTADLLYAELE